MDSKKIAALEAKLEEQQAMIEVMKKCLVALGVSPSVFEVPRKQS